MKGFISLGLSAAVVALASSMAQASSVFTYAFGPPSAGSVDTTTDTWSGDVTIPSWNTSIVVPVYLQETINVGSSGDTSQLAAYGLFSAGVQVDRGPGTGVNMTGSTPNVTTPDAPTPGFQDLAYTDPDTANSLVIPALVDLSYSLSHEHTSFALINNNVGFSGVSPYVEALPGGVSFRVLLGDVTFTPLPANGTTTFVASAYAPFDDFLPTMNTIYDPTSDSYLSPPIDFIGNATLNVTVAAPSSVPLPTSVAMGLAGLLGLLSGRSYLRRAR